ncbi:hypothetical protein AEAC466_18895 [Asticcacaulis sp. AC466]|uniref:TPM domain-containing protein n=1 Tax=Asticcacaulis sp. AC466 TaxID=1282362 RepID=UPI0003C3AE28|nr:TPM domain-containing protein [Asticcacaulis sp. AC466]ESQ82206.1 hypothetical protein AEAC466_18895 [Asticcacaulis sp. AC466]
MNRFFKPFWVALAVLMASLWVSSAFADPTFPDLNNRRVVDDANLLSEATKADLTAKLKGLEDATTDQVVIVTVPDLQGYEISDYGYQLGRHWAIGQSGKVQASNGQTYKDNGILLIVAPNERKVRIEVGYGLEPVMTDALSSIIIQRAILPQFKAGNYEAGIVAGTDQIIAQLSQDRGVAIQKAQAAQSEVKKEGKGFPLPVIIFIIILIVMFSRGWLPWFLLGSLLGGGGRGGGDWGGGGGWSGGGGGGGFSGGGGSFGGGGSSGGW